MLTPPESSPRRLRQKLLTRVCRFGLLSSSFTWSSLLLDHSFYVGLVVLVSNSSVVLCLDDKERRSGGNPGIRLWNIRGCLSRKVEGF